MNPDHSVNAPVNDGQKVEIQGQASGESVPHAANTDLAAKLKQEQHDIKAQQEACVSISHLLVAGPDVLYQQAQTQQGFRERSGKRK